MCEFEGRGQEEKISLPSPALPMGHPWHSTGKAYQFVICWLETLGIKPQTFRAETLWIKFQFCFPLPARHFHVHLRFPNWGVLIPPESGDPWSHRIFGKILHVYTSISHDSLEQCLKRQVHSCLISQRIAFKPESMSMSKISFLFACLCAEINLSHWFYFNNRSFDKVGARNCELPLYRLKCTVSPTPAQNPRRRA